MGGSGGESIQAACVVVHQAFPGRASPPAPKVRSPEAHGGPAWLADRSAPVAGTASRFDPFDPAVLTAEPPGTILEPGRVVGEGEEGAEVAARDDRVGCLPVAVVAGPLAPA